MKLLSTFNPSESKRFDNSAAQRIWHKQCGTTMFWMLYSWHTVT